MSASMRPTFMPAFAIAAARLTATVDLPTPPLALATTRILEIPGIEDFGVLAGTFPCCIASSDRRAPLRTRFEAGA